MTSYIAELFNLAFGLYALLAIAMVIAIVALGPTLRIKIVGGIAVTVLALAGPIKSGFDLMQREAALIERNRAMNAQFTKRCKEDARITIKRVVENVDGVFIMRPRKVATETELQDQFWMGDPYGYSKPEVERPRKLLYDSDLDSIGRPRAKPVPGYKFVELPNPIKSVNGLSFIRLSGSEPSERGYAKEVQTEVDRRASRFGFDWEDISTPEDRKYWIAGGRTRIIDLETNEVIAERIGYLVDPAQGGRVGGNTWLFSNGTACPKFENDWTKTQEFIAQVLISSKGIGYGKQ